MFTIDQIFLVFSGMPDLPDIHDDLVTSKKMRAFMTSVNNGAKEANTGSGNSTRQSAPGQGPSSRDRSYHNRKLRDEEVECGRCFALDHLWSNILMKEKRCSTCGKVQP